MALLLLEGFDEYTTSAAGRAEMNSAGIHSPVSNTWDISTTGGVPRTGRACIRATSVLDTFEWGFPRFFDNGDTMIFGCDIWQDFNTDSDFETLFSFKAGPSASLRFQRKASTFQFRMVNEDLSHINEAAGSFDFLEQQWAYWEFKIVVGQGTDGSYEVRMNGSTVLFDSNIDTNVDNLGINAVGAGNQGATQTRLDNVYLADGTGTINNNFLVNPTIGRLEVLHLNTTAVDGDGHQNDWEISGGTTNSENVDETTPDAHTTYVYSDAAEEKDFYIYDDLPDGTVSDSIRGVSVTSWSGNWNPTQLLKLRHMAYVNSTEIPGSVLHSPGILLIANALNSHAYPAYQTIFEKNESGGALSAADVNGMELGQKSEVW